MKKAVAMLTIGLMSLVFIIGSLSSKPVYAHGSIDSTEPADQAILTTAPKVIRITFVQPIVADSAFIEVIDTLGQNVAVGEIAYSEENATITARFSDDLANGIYIATVGGVDLADGHQYDGTFTFKVEAKTQISATMIVLLIAALALSLFAGWYYIRYVRPLNNSLGSAT